MIEVALDKITPYSKNAKQHPRKQIQQIAESIREFGFNQPLVVDKDNVIIVGHGRYEAAKLLNLDKVPVLKVNLSKKKAKAYRLADNKLNESEWDMEMVIEELKALEDEALKMNTGFEDFILNNRKDFITDHWNNDFSNPDGIDERLGYYGGSFWKDLRKESAETWNYFLPLPFNTKENRLGGNRQKIRYSRTNPLEIERIVKTYMREGDYFLESCVGWATFSRVAKFYGYNGVGVDIWETSLTYCEEQLKKIQGTGKVEIKKMDALNLEFPDNTFDFVYCNPPFFNLEGYKKTPDDLSVNKSYDEWLGKMKKLTYECYRVLKNDKLAVFTMADFRVGGYLVDATNEWMKISKEVGFKLWDYVVAEVRSMNLAQRKKAYELKRTVKCHENVLVFKKQ